MSKTEYENFENIAFDIRKSIIEILNKSKSGHSAGPLGMADIFSLLYFKHLNIDPKTQIN